MAGTAACFPLLPGTIQAHHTLLPEGAAAAPDDGGEHCAESLACLCLLRPWSSALVTDPPPGVGVKEGKTADSIFLRVKLETSMEGRLSVIRWGSLGTPRVCWLLSPSWKGPQC